MSVKGVNPTSLLRRSEGVVMAMQGNFHRLQLIVFTDTLYLYTKRLIRHHCCRRSHYMMLGRLVPETA